MIGVDTNVLLRLWLDDDQPQGRRIDKLIDEHAGTPGSLMLCDIVVAEAVWTLSRVYSRDKADQLEALQSLLAESAYSFENRETLVKAVALFEHASCGFSDCLIAANNAELGCEFTATFDRKMRGIPAVKVI